MTRAAERAGRARVFIGRHETRVADERNDRPLRAQGADVGEVPRRTEMIRSRLLLSTAALLVGVGLASAQGMREGTGGGGAGGGLGGAGAGGSHMSQGAGGAERGGGHAQSPSRSEGAGSRGEHAQGPSRGEGAQRSGQRSPGRESVGQGSSR